MIPTTLRILRYSLYVAGVLLLVAVAAVVALRAWWPNLADHKTRIEAYLTDQLGRPVLVQRLEARWDGWSPSFKTGGLRVRRKEGAHSSLRLGGIEVQVSPWSLLAGDLIFERFTLLSPTVEITRLKEGGVRIGDLVPGTASPGEDLGYLRWLFRQQDLRVENGTLIWRDERDTAGFLELSSINMNFVNVGDAHQFDGTARCPEPVCANIRIAAKLTGEPVQHKWDGRIDVDLDRVNLGNVPLAVHELLPKLERGQLDTRITTTWQHGKLAAAHADASLTQVELFMSKNEPLRHIDSLSTDLSWSRKKDGWDLALMNPSLSLNGTDLALDKIDISRIGSRTQFKLERIELQAILQVGLPLFGDQGWWGKLQTADPKADLRQVSFNVLGPWANPERVWLETEFAGVVTKPVAHWPGLRGVEGRISIGSHGGSVTIDATAGEVTLPRLFNEPLAMDTLQAQASWTRAKTGWEIKVPHLEVQNKDLAIAGGVGRVVVSDHAPYLELQANIPRVDVSRVPRYVPNNTPLKAARWLSRALVAGHASEGQLQWRGSVDRFPFTDGDGEFSARFKLKDGVFDYHKKWPAVSQFDADLVFHNATLRVNATTGKVMNSRIRQVSAYGENLYRRARTLKVDGVLDAKVSDAVDFLRQGPFVKNKDRAMELAGSGDGNLQLQLMLPLSQLKKSRVAGHYHTDDGTLRWPNGVTIEEINGTVQFTEASVSGEGLSARLLQGPVRLDVKTMQPRTPPIFAIDAHGEVDVKRLRPILGERLLEPMNGDTEWSARLTVDRNNADLRVKSELIGVHVDLPPPLGKPADAAMPVSALVRYTGSNQRSVEFDAHQLLKGALAFQPDTGRWRFLAGELILGPGTASVPEARELRFRATADVLDVDAWLEVLLKKSASDNDADSATMIDALRQVSLDIEELTFLQRNFGTVKMHAVSEDRRIWRADLDGVAVQGKALARLDEHQPWYGLALERLDWPRSEQAASSQADSDPGVLPEVTAKVQAFRYGAASLGSLDFDAVPVVGGWSIERFRSEKPELLIEADGVWRRSATTQRTEVNVKASSNDLGKAMTALALPEQIAGGEADLEVVAEWNGAPGAFALDNLSGEFEFSAKSGSFTRVEPGSGRLFGLLNVEVLMRRLTFDFSDVFAKGLVFDRINAKGTLKQGDMFTDGFYVIGPAALIDVHGRAGLAKEDYDLEIIVAPQVGANLSLLSAIASPAAGAVVFVVQKLFKKQIGKLVSYRYQITGPWESPEIIRIKQEPEDLENTLDRP